MSETPPPATGRRMAWSELPLRVREAIEAFLGSPVVSAKTQPTGFSPGVAARLACANGRRCFVKAVGAQPNPISPKYHRREAKIVAALPERVPAPRLLWTYDEDDWVALVFEEIDGVHPAEPWRSDELARVLAAIEDMSAVLTPSPFAARSAADVVTKEVRGWQLLRAAPPPTLDAWSQRHLATLAALEADAPRAIRGETLIHFDLRADNLLLAGERVVVLDWPHAAVGAAWSEIIFFAPSVAMQGGPPPAELLARFGPARAVDPRDVDAVIAAVAGFFTLHALEPPPPGLPTLRPFQAAQAEVTRAWLAERLALA